MILAKVSISECHSIIYYLRNCFPKSLVSQRCSKVFSAFSCDVDICVIKESFAVSKNVGFTISHNLFAFGKYPNMEKKSVSLFHHCLNNLSGPPAAASSAYQTCFESLVCTIVAPPY